MDTQDSNHLTLFAEESLEDVHYLHKHNRQKQHQPFCSNYRYLIGALVLISAALHNYGNYTLFIASIGMVSSDVLSNGLTDLRATHLALDPLAQYGANAASAGTCPVASGAMNVQLEEGQNATQISGEQQLAMALDAVALYTDVSARLASGNLVDWSIEQRGLLFTSPTLGALLFAVPLSRLGLMYGSKLLVTIGVVSSAVKALLFPVVAGQTTYWFVFFYELTMGALGGGIDSVVYPLAAAWFLPDEAGAFLGFYNISKVLGTAMTNFTTSQLLAYRVDWQWCFYLPGILLSFVSIAWIVFGADRPEKSRRVSSSELMILSKSVANCDQLSLDEEMRTLCETPCVCSQDKKSSCPSLRVKREPNWCAIIRCPTVWALILGNFAWSWNTKSSTLWPTYFAGILHLNTATIGWLTGYKGIIGLVYGVLFAHYTRKLGLQRPFNMSLTAYRRICLLFATLALGVSVSLMVALDCSLIAVILSLTIIPVVNGFNCISLTMLPLDMSPKDSGLLASFIRTIAVGDTVALPLISQMIAAISQNDSAIGDRFAWRLVWLLGFGLKLVACLVFALIARADPRSFSRSKPCGACQSLI